MTTNPELLPVERLILVAAVRNAIRGGADIATLAQLPNLADLVVVLRSNDLRSAADPAPWRVQLRPLKDDDIPHIYNAWTSPTSGSLWRSRGATPAPHEFGELMWAGTDTCLIAESVETGEPEVFLCSYGLNAAAGWTYVAFLRVGVTEDPTFRELFVGLEAMLLFIEHLFNSANYRKLMFEVPEPNLKLVAGLVDTDDDIARLPAHTFVQGAWHDVAHISLWRERWTYLTEPLAVEPQALAAFIDELTIDCLHATI